MLKPFLTRRFKTDLKKFEHNKTVKKELDFVLKILLEKEPLPQKFQDHALTGIYKGTRECHIKPNVLLIYWEDGEFLHLDRLGSHSELF